MSDNRRSRTPLWARVAAAVVALSVAVLVIALLVRLFSGTLGLMRGGGGTGEPDPQFAPEAELVTRPPELMGETGVYAGEEDPSAHWIQGEQTPVDRTAEELSREAAQTP